MKAIETLQTPVIKQPPKRQRVNPLGSVVTTDDSFKEIEDEMKRKEQEEKEKKKEREESCRKSEKIKRKQRKRKRKRKSKGKEFSHGDAGIY